MWYPSENYYGIRLCSANILMLCPTDLGLFQLNFLEIYEFFSIFSDQIWKHLIKLPALKQQAPIWNFKTLLLMKSYEKKKLRSGEMLAKNYIFDPTMGRIRLNKTDQQGLILKEELVLTSRLFDRNHCAWKSKKKVENCESFMSFMFK